MWTNQRDKVRQQARRSQARAKCADQERLTAISIF
jgi:hypothetical protein